MRKNCWSRQPKSRVALIVLALNGLVWTPAWAQVYGAANCGPANSPGQRAAQGMVDAAGRGYERDARVFEETARRTAQAIDRSVNCVSEVTRSINESIPSFGGGILGQIASQMVNQAASSACQMVQRAQQQAQQQINVAQQQAGGMIQEMPSGQVLSTPGFSGGAQSPGGGNSGSGSNSGGLIRSATDLLSRIF